MSTPVKIALYIVLVILATVSGVFALKAFGQLMEKGRPDLAALEQVEPEHSSDSSTQSVSEVTNSLPATNLPQTNSTEVVTNDSSSEAVAAANTNISENPTNAAVVTTNSTENTNTTVAASPKKAAVKPEGKRHLGLWSGVFLLSLAALGLLIAADVSHYFGNRALKVLYNDEGEGVANPEYETAEQVWANGDHLEAIRLMREYLNKHPREQFVALRIAEIYEKDLNNPLAAALEYEEVLKHKLPPDRWGWAAIHLCNLYFKLNQEQKAYELLRKIVKDYGQTPAAEKARKRLEQLGELPPSDTITESQVQAKPAAGSEPSRPESNLPPGFRPKK
jgi:TolA-binding protein